MDIVISRGRMVSIDGSVVDHGDPAGKKEEAAADTRTGQSGLYKGARKCGTRCAVWAAASAGGSDAALTSAT